jgi:hypothetical protein
MHNIIIVKRLRGTIWRKTDSLACGKATKLVIDTTLWSSKTCGCHNRCHLLVNIIQSWLPVREKIKGRG